MFVKMQLDIAKTVLKELFLVLIVGISLTRKNESSRTQEACKQSTICTPCKKRDSELLLPPTKSEKRIWSENQSILQASARQASDSVADLNKIAEEEGEDGKNSKWT